MGTQTDPRPIGIFDSGVGGLTVLKEIRKLLPNESIIYVGDTARVPYGSKTTKELFSYAKEIINFLLSKNVKAVVIACGTVSSTVYTQLQKEFPSLLLIDVIRPSIESCVALAEKGLRLGLIATTATIKSNAFKHLLAEKCSGITLQARACPLFASMVEAGLGENHPAIRFAADAYLSNLHGQIDALILGCTHYPLLINTLTTILGNIEFINIGTATALATKKILINNMADSHNFPTLTYYATGTLDVFNTTGSVILGENCTPRTIC